MKERPREVTANHLARRACVYARQSTPKQVKENEGSTDHQRDQVQFPLTWGWPTEAIDLIDEDLGRSGTTSSNRKGYQRLLEGIESGTVGAVFVSDLSRLGRNAVELLTLLNQCRMQNVLVAVNGNVCNLSNSSQLFGHQVNTLVTEYENVRRTEMMQAGRRAKARAGKAVSGPPTGYVRVAKGVWETDSDPAVQEAIRGVFRMFLKMRSLATTVRELRRLGIKIPSRRPGGRIEWREPSISLVVRILHNPAYTGDYYYPQRRINFAAGRTEQGFARTRRADPEEQIVIPNHHAAYVTEKIGTRYSASLR